MSAPLDLFTLFNNTSLGATDDPNSQQAQAALRQVQAYDPNASYRAIHGSDDQLLGYQLTYDASKLPGPNGGQLASANTGDFMPNFSTVQPHMQLQNPNAVQSGTPYGTITANSNINQPHSMLDTIGPALVLALGGAASMGLLGTGGGGFDLGAASPLDTMAPYNPTYGDMLPFNPSDADLGLAGGVNAPLGSAESSLYGPGALTDPSQALGGTFDPNLQVGGPLPMTQGYEQMAPFNPASPEYGQFAINPDGTPAAGAGGLPGVGSNPLSNFLSKIPSALSTLGKVPGLTGGSGAGGPGGGGGLLNLPPSQYGSLSQIVKRYYGGLLNG